MEDIRIPVTVGGITFKNPFYVASGPTTRTLKQLKRIEETGWAAASIKLSIDPAPYINRRPRYDLFEDRDALAFTTEKRLTGDEGVALIRAAKKELKELILFANITYAGDEGVEGWVKMAKKFEAAGADVIELNMCCPNMSFNVSLTTGGAVSTEKQTGASLGQQGEAVAEIVRAIKKEISIPLFVKLTPEGGKIAQVSKMVYEAGADAVSGTGNRMGIPLLDLEHPEKAVYHLQEEVSMSCYCGAWLKPLAQRDTYEIRKLCGDDIKIAATGGIRNWKDAVEMILCGADLLGICSETLISGYDIVRPMIKGLYEYMERHGYKSVYDFRGLIVPKMKTAQEVTLHDGYARIIQPKLSGPCKVACPYHVPAQAYVQSVGRGDFRTAYDIITEKGLLQGACAYICPSPCEDACVRGEYGSPVRIRELKKYVLDKGEKEGWTPSVEREKPNGHKVAVMGGSASGIEAAYRLSKAGYEVSLYEKEGRIGGTISDLANAGLVPEDLPGRLASGLERAGVKIFTGIEFGRDITAEDLVRQGYEAIVLAFGEDAEMAVPSAVPGAENVQGAEMLVKNPESAKGMRIAVIGDGLSALNAAYAALRGGAGHVYLAGKFNRKQRAVQKMLDKLSGSYSLIECMAVKAVNTADGKVTCVELSGSDGIVSSIPCDAVYAVRREKAPEMKEGPVFVARAGMTGGSNVIAAAAEGARLACDVDAFLMGDKAVLKPESGLVSAKRHEVLRRRGVLPYEGRAEEKPITSDEEAINEGKRCLGCGCGEGCQLCRIICTEFAPVIARRDEIHIVPEECVACGMCYNRCPNGNIEMVDLGVIK